MIARQRGELMKRRIKSLLAGGLLALALVGVATAGLFDDGWTAYQSGDYAAAMKNWRLLADQGNAGAQNNLGSMYENGERVPQDYEQAFVWYRKASDLGLAEAQANLGLMYATGRGVVQDSAQALVWLRKAAEQGIAEAQYTVGVMCEKGDGVAQDDAQAAVWYRKAAEQGNDRAQVNLGAMYDTGKGVPQDYAQRRPRGTARPPSRGTIARRSISARCMQRAKACRRITSLPTCGPTWRRHERRTLKPSI
jgi:hypothetical protein